MRALIVTVLCFFPLACSNENFSSRKKDSSQSLNNDTVQVTEDLKYDEPKIVLSKNKQDATPGPEEGDVEDSLNSLSIPPSVVADVVASESREAPPLPTPLPTEAPMVVTSIPTAVNTATPTPKPQTPTPTATPVIPVNINVDTASCSQAMISGSGPKCGGDKVMNGLGRSTVNGMYYLNCCSLKSSNNIVFRKTNCSTVPYHLGGRAICPSGKFVTGISLSGNVQTSAECCSFEANGHYIREVSRRDYFIYYNEPLKSCNYGEISYGVGDEIVANDTDQVFCSTFSPVKK